MAITSSAGSTGGLLAELSLEAQIGLLRAEEHDCDDPIRRASLLYETGHLVEEKQANDSLAIRDYLAAVNLAPQFRPTLYALIRMFERRRSFKNLIKLYEAEANSAVTAREKASALVDSGVLLADHLDQAELGHSMIEEAAQLDPSLQSAWLMLERMALCTGDQDTTERALLALAKSVETPEWKAILYAETAKTLAEHSRVDEAIKLLRSCSEQNRNTGIYLQQLEHIARKHGRHHALIDALEGQAALNQTLNGRGGVSVSSNSTASLHLACLLGEAARLRAQHGSDANLVLQNFRLAHAAAPEELALTMEWCIYAANHRPDGETLNLIRTLQSKGPSAPLLAALRILEAEVAQALGQRDIAQKALEQTVASFGDSCAARTLLHDFGRQGQTPQTRLQTLTHYSAQDKPRSFHLQWEAGQIAADELLDASKARSHYQAAAQHANNPTSIRRELYGELLRLGDLYAAREVGAVLLEDDIDDDERGALLRDQYELLRDVFGDLQATEELLKEAMQIPAAKAWAPDAGRIFAAMNDNSELCGAAHMVLAEQCDDTRLAASHYSAAARAFARAHQPSATLEALSNALTLVPDHHYALALMQYLVQTGERSPALIALFKQSATSTAEPSGLESSLLATAFESELNQDYAGAIQTYRQLGQLNPNAVAAFWHLRRVALRLGRKELLHEALEGLAARESAADRPGFAIFELAEFRDLVLADIAGSKPLLYSVLHHPDIGIAAAWMLLLQPQLEGEAHYHHAALQRLLAASNNDKPASLQRELVSLSINDGSEKGAEAVADTIDDLLEASSQNMWAHMAKYRSLRHRPHDTSQRAEVLMQMARATSDKRVASDLMLHAIRTSLISEAKDAQGDAVIFAHELDLHADPLVAAMAFDETLGGGDDPEMRARAFEVWMHHVGPEWTINARAALGRALVAGGRYHDAVRVLSDVVSQSSEDLGAWEALRYAARFAGMWAVAARACDRLSKHGTDELRATLLEESALIWANELHNAEEAEPRLRKALSLNPKLRQAYDVYYRFLRNRNDTLGLIDLVRMRLAAVDNPTERCRLLYEQAILYRSIGNLESCRLTVMQMLQLEPKHVGGLALLAETATMLEQWDTAITVLRDLAQAEVPATQRRLARLTAANLLERRKNDPFAALAELKLLEQSGDHDPELLQRSAMLAERTQQFEYAITTWTQLAQTTSGAQRATIEKRIARIYADHLHDRAAAIEAYQSALDADVTDVDACEELLANTLDSSFRHQLIFSFREEIYRALQATPLEPALLRKLLRAAVWAQDLDRERAILDVLAALDLASKEERLRWQGLCSRRVAITSATVEDDLLQILSATPFSGPTAMAAQIVAQALGSKPAQELKRLGVDKSHRIKRKAYSAERDELAAICATFRVRLADVYIGGHTREGIAALDENGASIWILGPEVTTPFSARSRFAIGHLIYGFRTGQASLMRRQSDQTTALLFDVAESMGVSFPQNASFFDPEALAPTVMRGLSHKSRKALEALWPQLNMSGESIVTYCQALERSATRTGLMLADDLAEVLRFIVGHVVDRSHVLTSSLATDLLSFWISDGASVFRKRLWKQNE